MSIVLCTRSYLMRVGLIVTVCFLSKDFSYLSSDTLKFLSKIFVFKIKFLIRDICFVLWICIFLCYNLVYILARSFKPLFMDARSASFDGTGTIIV